MRHRERGSALIAGLLWSLAVMLLLGLAVDVGRAFIVRRDLAALADDAALSGSQALDVQAIHEGSIALNPDEARAAALETIAAEPDVDGAAFAASDEVTVTVTERVPTVLLSLAGPSSLTVRAHATASPRAP